MASPDSFDIERLYKLFQNCISDDDTIDVDKYVDAYEELSKLFGILGFLFKFVASDVDKKTKILREYRKSKEKDHYETFEKMIKYEVVNNITNNTEKASGSRTLLRLHRALEFTSRLMHDLKLADDHEKMGQISKEMQDQYTMSKITASAYGGTLAKHHTWLVKQGVYIALNTLPSRKLFLEKLKHDDPAQAIEMLGKTAEIQERIFEITENIYTREKLHKLK